MLARLSLFVAILVLVFGVFFIWNTKERDGLNATDMQAVSSRGGQVTFRLPMTWRAEPEEDYMRYGYPHAEAGTLRLSVLTSDKAQDLSKSAFHWAPPLDSQTAPAPHPNGGLIVRGTQTDTEDDVPILLTIWLWEHRSPARSVVSIFSYTLLAHQLDDPRHRATLDMLDREIRAAKVNESPP